MRIIALIVVVLVWMIIASIPRGPAEKKDYSWIDHTPSQVAVQEEVKPEPPIESSKPPEKVMALNPLLPVPKAPDKPREAVAVKRAAPTAKGVGQMTICQRSGDSERSLILFLKQNGCELSYVKREGKETVARSHFSIQPCEQVRAKISKKLESAGFRCSAEG